MTDIFPRDMHPQFIPDHLWFRRNRSIHARVTACPQALIRLLKRQRTALGLSQRATSRRCGMGPMWVQHIESGRHVPSQHGLATLMDEMGITGDDIIAEIAALHDEEDRNGIAA